MTSSYPQPLPANQPSAAERVARAVGGVNTPRVCIACGSNWFYSISARQYSESAYSSMVGADLQIIGDMPFEIAVCLCGEPSEPKLGGIRGGRTGNEHQASFFAALRAAKEYRKQLRQNDQSELTALVESAVGKLASAFVMKDDLKHTAKHQPTLEVPPAVDLVDPLLDPAKPRLGRPANPKP